MKVTENQKKIIYELQYEKILTKKNFRDFKM